MVGEEEHSAAAQVFLDELRANDCVLDSTPLYSNIHRPVTLAADQPRKVAVFVRPDMKAATSSLFGLDAR